MIKLIVSDMDGTLVNDEKKDDRHLSLEGEKEYEKSSEFCFGLQSKSV